MSYGDRITAWSNMGLKQRLYEMARKEEQPMSDTERLIQEQSKKIRDLNLEVKELKQELAKYTIKEKLMKRQARRHSMWD
jgi:hypothetical protein